MSKQISSRFRWHFRAMLAIVMFLYGSMAATAITYKTLPTTAGSTLENNVIYTVSGNPAITAGHYSLTAALKVRANATAIIYIPKGCTLTVTGSEGNCWYEACAGIEVPSTSTLIITGEGTLIARGGAAGTGSNGGNGGDAELSIPGNYGIPGQGGAGGAGGGGAAAGIGGNGGRGHLSQEGPTRAKVTCSTSVFDGSGNNGYDSQDGKNGAAMGKVYILGSVQVKAYYGSADRGAAEPGNVGADDDDAGSGWGHDYAVGGGGPGGGGGSGYAATYGIGGGGPGGQCGATGGSGGSYWRNTNYDYAYIRGGAGAGGAGAVSGQTHAETRTIGPNGKVWGGYGGKQKANAATVGSNGTLYVSSTASLYVDGDRKADYTANSHYAIAGTLTLNANGGYLDSSKSTSTVYYGVMPDAVTIPTRSGYTCTGYYTAAEGGEMVFNSTGEASAVCTNLNMGTLYAHWRVSTVLNYINTKGEQALELDYTANDKTKTVVHVKFNSLHKGNNAVFGTAGSSDFSSRDIYGVWVNGTDKSFHFATGCGEFKSPTGLAEVGKDYYITLEDEYFEIDTVANATDHIYHHEFAVYPFNTNTYNLTFGTCNKPNASNANADITVYEVTVSEGDTEKYHLIPAYVAVSGKNGYGMYDKVHEKSYASKQGTAFEGDIAPCGDGKHPGYNCTEMYSSQGGTRHCVVCGYSERITPDTEPYISLNGKAYFNTGYKPNSKTTVKMHFVQHDNYGSNSCQDFFGIRANNSSFCMLSFNDSIDVANVRDGSFMQVADHGLTTNHEYYLTMSTNNVKITTDKAGSNVFLDYDYDSPSLNSTYEMPVGAISYGSSMGTCISNYDLFSFDIYEGDILKHSFVPSSQHGYYGFLDTTDNTFHQMAGSGASSNDAAQDENYISTNGKSYLDTGYSPNNNTSIFAHIKKNADNTFIPVFGTNNNSSGYTTSNNYYFSIVKDGTAVCFNIGGIYPDLTYATNAATDYFVRMSKTEGVSINAGIDETTSNSVSNPASKYTNNVANALSLYVGGHHTNSGTGYGDIKIYEFYIKEGDVYKRHFLPAKRDGALGFYDPITNQFYSMQGSGATGVINTCTEHKYLSAEPTSVDGKRYRKCLICDELVVDTINVVTVGRGNSGSISDNVIDLGTIESLSKGADIRLHAFTETIPEGYLLWGYNSSNKFRWGLSSDTNSGFGYCTPSLNYFDNSFSLGYGEYYIRNNDVTTSVSVDDSHSMFALTVPSSVTPKNTDAIGMKLGGYYSNGVYSVKMNVESLDIYEGSVPKRHFVAAKQNGNYGLFDTFTQAFHAVSSPKSATSYVSECKKHKYLDYQNADGTWQKHCRICDKTIDLTSDEMQTGNCILTNGYSYLDTGYAPTEDTKVVVSPASVEYDMTAATVTVGTKAATLENENTTIYSVDIYEGDELVRHFIPSLYGGKACMYETVNGDVYNMKTVSSEATDLPVASAYVPECSYHRFYNYDSNKKHCFICNNEQEQNRLVCTSANIRQVIPESGNTIYMDIVNSTSKKVEQYIGTKYPETTSTYTTLEAAVMNQGKLLHHYLPGKYNGTAGLYDEVCDTFIVVPSATVDIYNCYDHKYCKTEMKDGVVGKHCYICDTALPTEYYFDITFNANGGKGAMKDQTLIGTDVLQPNTFKKDLGLFAGWDINNTGSKVDDCATIKATETDHGSITLYAIWNDAFTYNGDTLAINTDHMNDIHIVDDGQHGFATSAGFNATNLSFTRQIEDGIKYGTVCLPFGIASDDKVSLYTVKSIEEVVDGASVKDVIKLQKVESVKAGEACIFRLNDDNDSEVVTFTCEADSLVMSPIDTGSNGIIIHGCFTGTTLICDDASIDYYGVMNDHFIHVTSSLTVKPYRAYITRTASAGGKPETLYLDFGDDANGIVSVFGDGISLEGAEIYTTDGIRLSAPRKGNINIVKLKNGEITKIKF